LHLPNKEDRIIVQLAVLSIKPDDMPQRIAAVGRGRALRQLTR
jgi:hypothetical protein